MSKKKERAEEQSEASEARASAPEEEKHAPPPGLDKNEKPQPAGEAGGKPPSAEERLSALEAEAADLKDKLLRKQADFENYRKRMFREKEETAKYANAALLTDLIGVIDDFERAIHSAEESRDFPTFLQGIGMIEKQLMEMLESRWGLKRFASLGEGFDPNRHEAVMRVDGPTDSKPTVVEDFQKGYYLHERVLRPAKVKVMVPAAAREAIRETVAERDGNSPPETGSAAAEPRGGAPVGE